MVFEKIGDSEDYLDVQNFRENAKYIFDMNATTVRIIRHNTDRGENLQGDFLGIRTNTFSDVKDLIKINIMSQAPDKKELKRHGYDNLGNVEFECFCEYDTEIDSKDKIEFITNYGYNIKPGDQFRIELEDMGLYSGQYCFKNFRIIKI